MARASIVPVLVGLVSAALAACSTVLGLDPPTLAPCLDGGCADAAATDAADGGENDAATDAPRCIDAALPDAAPAGVRCGGGCFALSYCSGSTPDCCQRTDDAGVTAYACTTSEGACDAGGGYPVVCASDDDCPGSDICCHFSTGLKCTSTSNCPSKQLVCRPDVPLDCPTGWKCDVPVVIDGVTSPYLECEP